MRRAVIVRNPNARRGVSAGLLLELARTACPSWDVEVVDTAAPGDPDRLAGAAATGGADAILACGGDGTLNGVLNGIRRAGTDTIVGVIPAGTANVWAQEAGIPRDAAGALALLEGGRIVRGDLGVANVRGQERRFLLMCGAGIDAAVVADVEQHPRLKRVAAQGAFALAGLGILARFQPPYVTIETDAGTDRHPLLLLVAGNTRLYGGVTAITSDARADDGYLDIAAFGARQDRWRLVDATRHLGRAALRRQRGWHDGAGGGFAYQRTTRAVLTPERALPVQLDGESFLHCGPDAPLTLSVEPRAIRLLIARGDSPLFTRDA